MWVVRAAASPFAPPLPLPAPVPCLVLFALLDALPLLPLPVAGRSLRQREGCVLRGGGGAASVLGTGATAEEGQKRVGRPPFQGAQGRRGGGHGGAARSCDVAGAVYRRCSRTLRRGACLSARCSRPTTAIRGRQDHGCGEQAQRPWFPDADGTGVIGGSTVVQVLAGWRRSVVRAPP